MESLKLDEFLSFAEAVGESLKGGELLLLKGELGCGKTTFVRGMAKGLGIDPKIVRSPTFTLVNVYPGRVDLYHADLYRIESVEDLFYVGLFEAVEEGEAVVAVEWADLFKDVWDGGVWIEIGVNEDGTRTVIVRDEEGILSGAIESWKEKFGQIR